MRQSTNLWAVASGSRAGPRQRHRPDAAENRGSFRGSARNRTSTGCTNASRKRSNHAQDSLSDVEDGLHGNFVRLRATRCFLNSNGVDFDTKRNVVSRKPDVHGPRRTDVSSFNYTGATLADLDRPLASLGTTDALMRQTTEQVRTRKVPRKFTGDLIITPDSIGDFLGFLMGNIGNSR